MLNLCWSNARSFISYANNYNNNGLDDDNPIVNHPTVAIYLGFQLHWTHWIFFLFILQDITIIYWHSQLVLVLFHHNIVDLVVGQVSVLFFFWDWSKAIAGQPGIKYHDHDQKWPDRGNLLVGKIVKAVLWCTNEKFRECKFIWTTKIKNISHSSIYLSDPSLYDMFESIHLFARHTHTHTQLKITEKTRLGHTHTGNRQDFVFSLSFYIFYDLAPIWLV